VVVHDRRKDQGEWFLLGHKYIRYSASFKLQHLLQAIAAGAKLQDKQAKTCDYWQTSGRPAVPFDGVPLTSYSGHQLEIES
jgi:hypothetical protein